MRFHFLSEFQESVISLVLHSGLTGSPIGQPVSFNFTTPGKLIGPVLHETAVGAYYILLGIGKRVCPFAVRECPKCPGKIIHYRENPQNVYPTSTDLKLESTVRNKVIHNAV